MKNNCLFRTLVAGIVLALLVVVMPVSVALASHPVSVYPDIGPTGTLVLVSGTGFTANSTVEVYFPDSSTLRVRAPVTATGAFYSSAFDITPYPVGSKTIWVRDVATATWHTATFTIVPQITLDKSSGYVNEEVKVSGTGFAANSDVTISFDNANRASARTNNVGSFANVPFTVPESYQGSHMVRVKDASNDFDTDSFATKHSITTAPASGVVGTEVTVTGNGFAANKEITITFNDGEVAARPAVISTNDNGSFTTSFNVPAVTSGGYQIMVSDGTNQQSGSFTISASISLSRTSGKVGDKIVIRGGGFQANEEIRVTFDSLFYDASESQPDGSFSLDFNIPSSSRGTHQIEASDGTNRGSANFIISATISLSRAAGFVGDEIGISGTGFQANKLITITFDREQVKSTATDRNGSFSTSFPVPVRPAGSYRITVSDDTSTEEAYVEVSTTASISPSTSAASPGHVGSELTVSGLGFIAGRTVTVTYDDERVATATVGTDGTFSTTFKAPASQGGEHIILANDGVTIKQFTFVMESAPPAIPMPLKPEMGSEMEAATYFDWEEVTDPSSGVTYSLRVATSENFSRDSIVLERSGLTQSEYTLTTEESLKPAGKKAPYYWQVKAVDGAFNESLWTGAGSFYVASTLVLPQPVIYSLFGIGALLLFLLGFWLGRRTAYR